MRDVIRGVATRLQRRIALLAHTALHCTRSRVGTAALAAFFLTISAPAWAQPPANFEPPVIGTMPVRAWTPSAQAPPNTLSHALEGQRHDRFIELAKQGDIDFVLFGTTDAEMFWWPDRGRPVWDRAFAGVKAANFGAQGTTARSLLWRMRNGELDGYRAKLIVLQMGFCMGEPANVGSAGADPAIVFADCTPILLEIASRQPLARVLMLPPFPRGLHDRTQWTAIATANQRALSQFVDSRNVFYADFSTRFFLADGSHDSTLWSRTGVSDIGVGMQPAAFEVVAEELQPWLDRFVR